MMDSQLSVLLWSQHRPDDDSGVVNSARGSGSKGVNGCLRTYPEQKITKENYSGTGLGQKGNLRMS